MIKRLIGISIMALGIIIGSYFSIYFSLINDPTMLLVMSLSVIVLFLFGLFILVQDRKERKFKKEKKIILEMMKKARIAQERQTYSGAFDDLKRRRMY